MFPYVGASLCVGAFADVEKISYSITFVRGGVLSHQTGDSVTQ